MEGVHLKGGGGGEPPRAQPQLLDLIPSKREWMVRDRGGGCGGVGSGVGDGYASAAAPVVEKQLELRLGPPGGGLDVRLSSAVGGSRKTKMVAAGEPCSVLSLGSLFSSSTNSCCRPGGSNHPPSAGAKRGFLDTLEDSKQHATAYQPQKAGFFGGGGACKEDAGADGGNAEKQPQHQHRHGERKAAATSPAPSANAAAPNDRSQTRTASQPPVVGWPPIRSFRKNIASASSSCKPPSSSSSPPLHNSEQKPESSSGGGSKLVKINMDGVPIGRKVDLSACSGYDRLSAAVDQLFRGLLSAQRVMSDQGGGGGGSLASAAEQEGGSSSSSTTPAITGLLDGSGEYTLVYEDNEGDRMLVGDVPWEMFVSTVKRLRVLKSSELPSLSLGVAGGGTRRTKASPHHRDPPPSGQGAAA